MSDDETKATDTPVKTDDASVEKRGRGRPKKSDSEKKAKPASGGKRGRPRKSDAEKSTDPKTPGKRGRPRKPDSEKQEKSPGKRGRPKGSGKPKTHPAVSEMVMEAVKELKDRKGCSLSAVKKYIAANYKVDMEKQTIFIRRFVRKCLDSGELTLVRGSSTTGSFKLSDPDEKKKPKAKGTPGKRGRPKGSTKKKTTKSVKKEKTGKRGRPKKHAT